MKSNLLNIKLGLSLFIGISVFWGCDNNLAPIKAHPTNPVE